MTIYDASMHWSISVFIFMREYVYIHDECMLM